MMILFEMRNITAMFTHAGSDPDPDPRRSKNRDTLASTWDLLTGPSIRSKSGRFPELGPVSQKSRNLSGLFRVPQFPFNMSSQRRGSKPSNFAILLVFSKTKNVKRSAFQNERIVVSQLAFRRGPKRFRGFRETRPWFGPK